MLFKVIYIRALVFVKNRSLMWGIQDFLLPLLLLLCTKVFFPGLFLGKSTALSLTPHAVLLGILIFIIIQRRYSLSFMGLSVSGLLPSIFCGFITFMAVFLPLLTGFPLLQYPQAYFNTPKVLVYPLLMAAAVEELWFRGILLPHFQKVLSSSALLITIGLLFAVIHIQGGLAAAVLAFFLSMPLSVIRLRTHSIIGCILAHSGINFILFAFYCISPQCSSLSYLLILQSSLFISLAMWKKECIFFRAPGIL